MMKMQILLLLLAGSLSAQAPFQNGVNLSGWFQATDARQLPLSRYGEADFDNLKALGVDGVRLPVNFAAFVGPGPEYRLDPRLLAPLDAAVDGLLARGLGVILDNHSDWDLPRFRTDREGLLKALWAQLSVRYQDRGPGLVYEIQNEPHDMGASTWDDIQQKVLDVIRKTDARTVVVTGSDWGGVTGLLALKRYTDKNLVYSFHFYDPFRFTHQGAEWAGQGNLSGVRFAEKTDAGTMAKTLDSVAAFARTRGVPVYCGEFGVYTRFAGQADRAAWYRTLRGLLAERRIPWSMWDYRGSFGLFRKDSAELFEQDVDLEVAAALGFRPVAQKPVSVRVETTGFPLSGDAWAPGTREASWSPGGSIDFANPDRPQQGRASVLLAGVDRYGAVSWDFVPWKDLSALAGRAELVFWARSNSHRFTVDLRFVDGPVAGIGPPWRLAYTLDQNILPGDGAWHRIAVPLDQMRDAGAWDGTWHHPLPGVFDWKRVARFEIATEQADLKGVELGFDEIEVVVK